MGKGARFKVDPKLAALLGEGYRSSEEALKELVDNAWDADAENVTISLPAELSGGPITITDDGTGMTDREVNEDYLYVASDRRTRKGDRTLGKHRLVKGRKGIGKFAGLMAAEEMALETRANGKATRIRITKADLRATSQKKADLEKIDLPIETSACPTTDHGTTITLSSLSQNLGFPNAEKLRQILFLEYGRQEDFRLVVNGELAALDDLPGTPFDSAEKLPEAGPVSLKFTISDGKPFRQAGIAIRVGGKLVGRPTLLGLEEDETIPPKLLKRVYGEISADGLSQDVTADGGAIVENSLGLGKLREWAGQRVAEAVKETFKAEVGLQKARLAKEVRRGLDKLPENRRGAAERAINRVLERLYGDSEDKIKVVVSLMLESFENDDYWAVLKSIDDATRADVGKLAEVLGDLGLVDVAIVAQQAAHRLAFLDEFDKLIANPETLEAQVHTAIAANLWILGSRYRLITSNKSLVTVLKTWLDQHYVGDRGTKRPDLFLAMTPRDEYLLVEFKRPSHAIGRDDETQAHKYRDDLSSKVAKGTISVVVIGGSRDPSVATRYKTDDLRVLTYADLVAVAREELGWLLQQLKT